MTIKSSINILVVDDIASTLLTTKQVLNQIGLKNIFEASNGEEALGILSSKSIGLIICELKIPKLNALQLLSSIKSSEDLKTIPFILSTSDSKREIILKASKLGASGILVKPFSKQALTEVLVKIYN